MYYRDIFGNNQNTLISFIINCKKIGEINEAK